MKKKIKGKNIDPMTNKPFGTDGMGGKHMPGGKAKSGIVQNSTSTNPAAKKVGKVKGTPANNKKYQHVRTPRYK